MEDEKKKEIDVDDMVFMAEFTGPLAVENVRNRFKKGKIYTNVSSILISVNPYKDLGLYKKDFYDFYQFDKKLALAPPHVFNVAKTAYRQMLFPIAEAKHQSILISGESGAGKTEATKLFLRYFTRQSNVVSSDKKNLASIEKRILQANPILEAFGNAKTLRNDNSSRFGRWLNIYFNNKGQIMMSSMTKYLLEESRVIFQDKGERNYNIFYMACAAWDKEIVADESASMSPKKLEYLNKSGCYKIAKTDDYKLYEELIECFQQLGFSEKEESTVLNTVKTVLSMGNVKFIEGPVLKGKGSSKIDPSSLPYVAQAAKCLEVDFNVFKRMLTVQDLTMPSGSFYSLPREVKSANSNRDSLAKAVYGRMFTWLVERINKSFRASYTGDQDPETMRLIGILDIFGFEAFKHNSFEQLCINFANEKLQQYFVKQVFKMELKLYQEEKIDVKSIPYPDNSDTLALLEKKNGVFLLLRDELKVKTGTDLNFVTKLQKMQKKHPKFKAPRMMNDMHFTIKHFAEPVKYNATGFLIKNRSKLTEDVKDCMRSSENEIIKSMFAKPVPKKESTVKRESESKGRRRGGRRKKKKGAPSLAAQFQTQLSSLMSTIQKTESHFVRCIKPNKTKEPMAFEDDEVMRQLQTCGVIDAVTVRKLGYTNRMSHWMFFKRYGIIRGGTIYYKKGVDFRKENFKICEEAEKLVPAAVKKKIPIKLWQSGTSILFYKSEMQDQLEALLQIVQDRAATKINATVKMFLQRRKFLEMKSAYRSLRAAMKSPSSSLRQIEDCLKRCKELKVIDRLLREAENSIAALVNARKKLTAALTTSKPTIKERVDLMKRAMKETSKLIHNNKEQKIIKSVVPALLKLQQMIPRLLGQAYKSQESGQKLLDMIKEVTEFCSKFPELRINLRHKKEVSKALSIVRKLDEVETNLSMVTDARNLQKLESILKNSRMVAGQKFERPALKKAVIAVGALKLEARIADVIKGDDAKKLKKMLEEAEKTIKKNPEYQQYSAKLSDQVAKMREKILLAKQMQDAIARVKDTQKVATNMGSAGVGLLQESIAKAKMLAKKAGASNVDLLEMKKVLGSAEKKLETTMSGMGTDEREKAKKEMEKREKQLKAVEEANRAALQAQKEASEQLMQKRVNEIKEKSAADLKAMEEKYKEILERETKVMNQQIKLKDDEIKKREESVAKLNEKVAKVEKDAKEARQKLDALFNPTDLVSAMQASIIRHAQQLNDPATLISWYTTAVFKGLNSKPLSPSLQLLQVQTLMGRPEVQSSGVVPFLERAVRLMTAQAMQGDDENEEVSDDEPPPPPSPPSDSPPPSPKWRQNLEGGLDDEPQDMYSFGQYDFDESKYVGGVSKLDDQDMKFGAAAKGEEIVPPPLEDSSDEEDADDEKTIISPIGEHQISAEMKRYMKQRESEYNVEKASILEDEESKDNDLTGSMSMNRTTSPGPSSRYGKSPTSQGSISAQNSPLPRVKSDEQIKEKKALAAEQPLAACAPLVPTERQIAHMRTNSGSHEAEPRHRKSFFSLSKFPTLSTRKKSLTELPDLSQATVIREGYLKKRGGINADKALKKRYFRLMRALNKYYFAYYSKKYDKKELGVIILTGAIITKHEEKEKYLKILAPEGRGARRLYLIKAETLKHRDAWLQQLQIYCSEASNNQMNV